MNVPKDRPSSPAGRRFARSVAVALAVRTLGCGLAESPSSPSSGAVGSTSSGAAGGSVATGAGGAGTTTTGSTVTTGSTGTGGGGTMDLLLPIEVLGSGAPDEPVIAPARIALASADASAVKSLYVSCHRCGFYDPPEFEALKKPLTKVKASLRIVGGQPSTSAPWIDITDATVTVDPVAAAHGGIHGGLVTLGFHLAIDDATRARLVGSAGSNLIEFRFNGTDGNSNGLRILDVELQDAAGKNLGTASKRFADIGVEKKAPLASPADLAAGQMFWSGRNLLIKSPIVPNKIRAACADCHAAHGRDLQFFNYSNVSIVQRSRFHGLSETQGRQIAAYLRSANAEVPHVPAAAPWNPPYQPGPGLDARPAVEWAAGAGLDAVLPDGKAFMKAFVGKPLDTDLTLQQADLDKAHDLAGVLNTREMAVPLQFPDWNAWLPTVHPLDVWTPDAGQTEGLFETGKDGANPVKVLADLDTWLAAHKNPNGRYGDWTHLKPDEKNQLQGMLANFGYKTTDLGGGSRGTRVSSDPAKPFGVEIAAKKMAALLNADTAALADLAACGPAVKCTPFSTEAFLERTDYGLYHWMAVKQWEVVHTWGLEEPALHGHVAAGQWVSEGEKRGWPYSWPSVFYVAPHILYAPEMVGTVKREFYFSWENRLVSYYRTNQWYQLQMTVNSGWPGASNGAMDWPYHMGFTNAVVDDLTTAKAPAWISAAHVARYLQIRIKLAQLANTDLPFDDPDPTAPNELFKNKGIQSKADLLFKLGPAALLDASSDDTRKTRFRLLDEIAPGLHLMAVNASIAFFNSMYAATDPAKYRRCDPANTTMGAPENHAGQRFCADRARTPLPMDKGMPYLPFDWTTDQFTLWGILRSTQMGAEPARVKVLSDWADRMWPP